MKLSSKLSILALVAVAVILFITNKSKRPPVSVESTEEQFESPKTTVSVTPSEVKPKSISPIAVKSAPALTKSAAPSKKDETPLYAQGPLTAKERESVDVIVKAISQAIAKKSNSQAFMQAIVDLHLKPKFMDEGSNAVGSMVTVRTHDALEGTRYLHGQFAGEKNNANYLEHVSFQIRPGSNSFQTAVEILNQYLPKTKTVKESDSDYVRYNTDDGYVAWVKIATREDLKSNKYNASSKEEVGSVIVTIEQEIHDMDEDGHSH